MLSTDLLCYDSATGRVAFFASDGSSTLQQPAAQAATWEQNLIMVPGHFIASTGSTVQGTYSDLFTYNRSTGIAQFYSTDSNGNRTPAGSPTTHNWTQIVAGIFTPNGSYTDLLCYDQTTGAAEFYSTDGAGNLTLLIAYPFSHWTHLVPGFFRPNAQTMDILFYDAPSGNAAFYAVWNGNITLLQSYTNWRTTWAQIVPGTFRTGGNTDDLLLYDPSTGYASFLATDGYGGTSRIVDYSDWSHDWSNIVAGYFWQDMTCSGLLIYSAARDIEGMQSFADQAVMTSLGSISSFGGWTDIIAGKFLRTQLESWRNFDELTLTRVEAYASSDSVAPGQTIDICIEAEQMYRGHYFFQFALNVARSGLSDFTFEAGGVARPQQTPPNASSVGCGWRSCATIPIPSNCRSGVYFTTITVGSISTQVPFVVRPDPGASASGILLTIATPTMQAYNPWGGQSLYDGIPGPRGPVVSYDRPYSVDSEPNLIANRVGNLSGDFITWLEVANEFAIDYCTDVDLHFGTVDLAAYALLVVHWHSEYWSFETRANVEAFLAQGGNLAILGANTCWWQVRFDDTGRLMTCYKYAFVEDPRLGHPTADPFATSRDPNQTSRTSIHWWDTPVNWPEISVTGLTFRYGWAVALQPQSIPPQYVVGYTVDQPNSWVFRGIGLTTNNIFGQESSIIGGEVDSAFGSYPDGTRFGNIYWSSLPPFGGPQSPPGFLELAHCNIYLIPGWNIYPAQTLTITDVGTSSNTLQVSDAPQHQGGTLIQGSVTSGIANFDSSTNTLTLQDSGLVWQAGQTADISWSEGWASMGIFQYGSGGFVFNAGTISWSAALDALNQSVVSRITINVLRGLRDLELSTGNTSLIESSLGAGNGNPGSFEALLLQQSGTVTYLVHYSRNNSNPALPWKIGPVVSSSATGPACLIESSDGNFQALVLEGNLLVNYTKDNSDPTAPWKCSYIDSAGNAVYNVVSSSATGPACLIESSDGSFQALVLEGADLVCYTRDYSAPANPWHRVEITSGVPALVTGIATGPACLIESSSGNFEALVLEGTNLVHYTRDNSGQGINLFHRGEVVSSAATGPASLIESGFKTDPTKPGNFEALVLEGTNLVHYTRDNSEPTPTWSRGEVVSSAAAGPASLIESSYKTDPTKPGNFEVVVQEPAQAGMNQLVAYWRDNSLPTPTWYKGFSV